MRSAHAPTCALLLLAWTICCALGDCGNINNTFPVGKLTMTSIQRPEGLRYFAIYVPSKYSAQRPTAVQFLFHGIHNNCTRFLGESQLLPLAERDTHILVAPCGSEGLVGPAWNAGTCCGFAGDGLPDDNAFVLAVLDLIRTKECVDDKKIISSGFSNGAMMASVLGCYAPQVFRVLVVVSGVVEIRWGNKDGLKKCDSAIASASPSKRPSVLKINGDADFTVPFTGNFLLGFPNATDDTFGWVGRNRCAASPSSTLNLTHYTNQVYRSCISGWGSPAGAVELVRHLGGAHVWEVGGELDYASYTHEFVRREIGGF